jgi:hypothetical protein
MSDVATVQLNGFMLAPPILKANPVIDSKGHRDAR